MELAVSPRKTHASLKLLTLALVAGGCESMSDLDTDAPWPSRPDTGSNGGVTVAPFVGELDSIGPEVAASQEGDSPELSAAVDGDLVMVLHTGLPLAPCDDFGIEGMTITDDLLVTADYVNNDCGELERWDLKWSFPRPESPGVWTLQAGEETTSFTVD